MSLKHKIIFALVGYEVFAYLGNNFVPSSILPQLPFDMLSGVLPKGPQNS